MNPFGSQDTSGLPVPSLKSTMQPQMSDCGFGGNTSCNALNATPAYGAGSTPYDSWFQAYSQRAPAYYSFRSHMYADVGHTGTSGYVGYSQQSHQYDNNGGNMPASHQLKAKVRICCCYILHLL